MAHGLPDFGVATAKVTIAGLADMAELAARLGSIVTFERKGDVLWLDDFESGVHKWDVEKTDTRGSVTSEGNVARNGGFCAKLTTGNQTDDIIRIQRRMPVTAFSKIGLELSFTIHANLKSFYLELHLNDGTHRHNAAVWWVKAETQWKYTDAGHEDALLLPLMNFDTTLNTFVTVKLVADFITHYFEHLQVNNTVFDMSTIPYYYTEDPQNPFLHLYIHCDTGTDEEAISYVDDVIVTQNEP